MKRNSAEFFRKLFFDHLFFKNSDDQANMTKTEPAMKGNLIPTNPDPTPAISGITPWAKAITEPFIPRAAPCLAGETLLLISAVRLAIDTPWGIAKNGTKIKSAVLFGKNGYITITAATKIIETRRIVRSLNLAVNIRKTTSWEMTMQAPTTPKKVPTEVSEK